MLLKKTFLNMCSSWECYKMWARNKAHIFIPYWKEFHNLIWKWEWNENASGKLSVSLRDKFSHSSLLELRKKMRWCFVNNPLQERLSSINSTGWGREKKILPQSDKYHPSKSPVCISRTNSWELIAFTNNVLSSWSTLPGTSTWLWSNLFLLPASSFR